MIFDFTLLPFTVGLQLVGWLVQFTFSCRLVVVGYLFWLVVFCSFYVGCCSLVTLLRVYVWLVTLRCYTFVGCCYTFGWLFVDFWLRFVTLVALRLVTFYVHVVAVLRLHTFGCLHVVVRFTFWLLLLLLHLIRSLVVTLRLVALVTLPLRLVTFTFVWLLQLLHVPRCYGWLSLTFVGWLHLLFCYTFTF